MLYTLTVTLQNRKPLNERTIEISDNQTFETLSKLICEAFGFSGEHLWEFRQDDTLFINHPEFNTQVEYNEDFQDEDFDDLQGTAKNVSSKDFKLSDYFSSHNEILYVYDFGENRRFDVKKTSESNEDDGETAKIIGGKGTYLIEDSGGPIGLKEYIDQYAKQQRDGDRRETYDDFSERIQPAMQQFNLKKHQ